MQTFPLATKTVVKRLVQHLIGMSSPVPNRSAFKSRVVCYVMQRAVYCPTTCESVATVSKTFSSAVVRSKCVCPRPLQTSSIRTFEIASCVLFALFDLRCLLSRKGYVHAWFHGKLIRHKISLMFVIVIASSRLFFSSQSQSSVFLFFQVGKGRAVPDSSEKHARVLRAHALRGERGRCRHANYRHH